MEKSNNSWELRYAKSLIKTLASHTGYNLDVAVKELIDNSIDAGAKNIDIVLRSGEFRITDDGRGMDSIDLQKKFLVVGDDDSRHESDSIGQFGIGGKSAMFSMVNWDKINTFTIRTKKENNLEYELSMTAYMDGFTRVEKPLSQKVENNYHGTTISIGNVKKCNGHTVKSICNKIAITYHKLLSTEENDGKIKIRLNGQYIMPTDPLYRANKHVLEGGYYKEKTVKLKNGEKIKVAYSYLLNGVLDDDEMFEWESKSRNGEQIIGLKTTTSTARSGIYVYFDGRCYTFGNNWDKLIGSVSHTACNGLRIELEMPSSMKTEFMLSFNKNDIGKSLMSIESLKDCSIKGHDAPIALYQFLRDICEDFWKEKGYNDKATNRYNNIGTLNKSLSKMGIKDTLVVENDSAKDSKFITIQDSKLYANIAKYNDNVSPSSINVLSAITILYDKMVQSNKDNFSKEDIIDMFNEIFYNNGNCKEVKKAV